VKTKTSDALERPIVQQACDHQNAGGPNLFERAACAIAYLSGRPGAFLIAALMIAVWAISGPVFGFSDTWQLVINTSTTIVTFLMVFLIQNSQHRDTAAIQIKLAELILRLDGADDKLATAEDLSDEELERLHREYRERADQTLASLDRRRGDRPRAA
jgi:low affinity Fe/Cu permease